jgi:hypothetical protein
MSRALAMGLLLIASMAVGQAFAPQQEQGKPPAAPPALRLQLEGKMKIQPVPPLKVEIQLAPPAGMLGQPWPPEQFDRWVFPQLDRAGARQWLDAQLARQIEKIDRAYDLTAAQKQKLRLAGRGNIKRFFDRYESVKEEFSLTGGDGQKSLALQQEIQSLQAAANDLFHEDSLLFKSLLHTLTGEQLARYQALDRERRAFAQVRLLQGHQGEGGHAWVTRLAVAPDGRRVVTAGLDAVRLWDLESGKTLRVFGGDPRGYWSVAFSRDGRRIAAGSNDDTARV